MRALALALLITAACANGADTPLPGAGDDLVDLTGAGATFPYPVYARWISRFATDEGIRINYQSIGSGGGLQALDDASVDFGASDVPLDSAALSARATNDIVQVPVVVGGVVVTYNLPDLTTPLQFDGAVLADIFAGRITRWSDPRIAKLNPGVLLPVLPIRVVHRADPSGTTRVFSRFLAASSNAWSAAPGTGPEGAFAVGTALPGNEGVAVEVKVSVGTIAYVEQSYATLNRLPAAALRNASGAYVLATPASLTAAAISAVAERADGLPATLLGATDSAAYPLAELSWVIVRRDVLSADKLRTLAAFLRWSLDNGDAEATTLGYAPLPEALRTRVRAIVDTLAAPARSP
jgi:phosphate transport system substrate-binding protein